VWLLIATAVPAAAAPNTTTAVDVGGQYSSLEIDAAGLPVISHYDPGAGDLRLVHCASATCGGIGNSLVTVDGTNNVGRYSSLELDASGNPVISYQDVDQLDLKVVRCGDAYCGSGNVFASPDASVTSSTGLYSSLALNGSGNAVVSYFQVPLDNLRIVRCDNAACSSRSLQIADTDVIVGSHSSITLDAFGNPVVSYYDESDADLKVIHCVNSDCSGGGHSIQSVDGTLSDVGKYTSIVLDSEGYPVVSYYDETNDNLKVLHCGDPNCSAGNTITSPDTSGDTGLHTSIALDSSGRPVVASYNATTTALRVLRCGDETCSAGNSNQTPDSAGVVGQYASLALNSAGNPVVSYYDATNGELKLLRCGDATCAGSGTEVGGVTGLVDAPRAGNWALWTVAVILAVVASASVGLAASRR
jgi:hypothetical protein